MIFASEYNKVAVLLKRLRFLILRLTFLQLAVTIVCSTIKKLLQIFLKGTVKMENKSEICFLGRRMRELRETNKLTLDEMLKKLSEYIKSINENRNENEKEKDIYFGLNKSSLSRIENGQVSEKNLKKHAENYCYALGMSKEQTNQFLRGYKIAVPDTSALLKNPQLIDELNKEYGKVIIAKIVVDELDKIKNTNSHSLGRKAWEVLRGISYGDRTILKEYTDIGIDENEDCKIISIAREAVEAYGCKVDIITEDTDYSAYLKSDENVSALHLREYMATKQEIVNMTALTEIDKYFADNYDNKDIPDKPIINSYLSNGNTLIISAVRNRSATLEQRKAKIRWLIVQGADVNKRDCNRRYFPPISHAIQMKDYEMFLFLLNECKADPNIGSRNPYDAGKVRQKNEGNMPLMIAAWEGLDKFVEALCKDERTSINQQDANGFTALIKACANGNDRCKKILLEAGADEKILDINGKTYKNHCDDCFEFGRLKDRFKHGEKKPSKRNKK